MNDKPDDNEVADRFDDQGIVFGQGLNLPPTTIPPVTPTPHTSVSEDEITERFGEDGIVFGQSQDPTKPGE